MKSMHSMNTWIWSQRRTMSCPVSSRNSCKLTSLLNQSSIDVLLLRTSNIRLIPQLWDHSKKSRLAALSHRTIVFRNKACHARNLVLEMNQCRCNNNSTWSPHTTIVTVAVRHCAQSRLQDSDECTILDLNCFFRHYNLFFAVLLN